MIKQDLPSEGYPPFYVHSINLIFRTAKLSFLAVIPFLFFCRCERQGPTHPEAILGHWGGTNVSIEYTAEGDYNMTVAGKLMEFYNTGQLKYSLECSTDNEYCWAVIFGVKERLETREKLMIEGDLLFSIGYKSLEGIEHHIDEVGVLKKCRDNTPCNFDEIRFDVSDPRLSRYYLPADLRGAFYVAYGESDAASIPLDENGNRLITIPSNGLLRISDEPWPLRFIKRGFEAYQIDSTGQDVVPVRCIFNHDLAELKRDSSLLSGYHPNSLYVLFEGYNQMARSSLHEKIDERVSGNVEFFRIDTLKNLVSW